MSGYEISNLPTTVRHFMWNDDYIELLSHKLDLQQVRTLVDIGAGMGIIAGLFAIYMKPGSKVHGFNGDPEAIEAARAQAAANPFSVDFRFDVADPARLPLKDGEADLVICQHTLSHAPDTAAVLAEMVRVVRPGGRIVAFEPNRMAQSLILDSVTSSLTLDERLNQVRFQALYERGKRKSGAGDDSVGDRLPGLFMAAGLEGIEVRISDKAAALVPPYDTPEKRARVEEILGWLASYEANCETIKRHFLAGGGTEAEFEAFQAQELAENAAIREQIAAGKFVHAGGLMTYIVIGKKPL